MDRPKQKVSRTFTEFAGALHYLNADRAAKKRGPDERAELKRRVAALYDLAAGWKNVLAWNWGYDSEDLHREIAERIPDYDADQSDGLSEQLYYFTLRQIPGSAAPGGRILEVGCGSGFGLNFLSRLHPDVGFVGLDISRLAVDSANRRLSRPGRLDYVHGDAESLPFGDASFDGVICVESAHNYPAFDQFLGEVRRVLKPGGAFSLVDLYTKQRLAMADPVLRDPPGMRLRAQTDVTEAVRRAVTARMQPGSRFRGLARRAFPFPLGPLNERVQMLSYGAEFAAVEKDFLLRLVKRLTAGKNAKRLVFESYRHHHLQKDA